MNCAHLQSVSFTMCKAVNMYSQRSYLSPKRSEILSVLAFIKCGWGCIERIVNFCRHYFDSIRTLELSRLKPPPMWVSDLYENIDEMNFTVVCDKPEWFPKIDPLAQLLSMIAPKKYTGPMEYRPVRMRRRIWAITE